MSAARDAIVIGAGPNGLTAAALLARAGRHVVLLEQRDVAGGLAASEEFHPGYRSAGLLHDTSGVRRFVIERLQLRRHGLRLRENRPDLLVLRRGHKGLLLAGDDATAASAIAAESASDAERYTLYRDFLRTVRPVLSAFLDSPPADLVELDKTSVRELLVAALRLRRLGKARMMELLRAMPLCVRDWLDEWFETASLKAALALPAIAGNFLGPRSPGSTANLLLWEAAAGPGVEGDGHALVAALLGAAKQHGVELRTGARVRQIRVRDSSVVGVSLEDGERIDASLIVSSCDPKRTLDALLPQGATGHRLHRRILNYRTRGTTAQVLLALNAPLRFACDPDRPIAFARTTDTLDDLERAFDAVKYRQFSSHPVLDIHVPTVSSPDLAPAGHSVVSILVHFAPYDLEGGWNDEQRRILGERVRAILEEHAPGVSDAIVSGQVISPVDIEKRYGIAGGHIYHGEHGLDQLLVRPVPECARYRTPLAGLYLCGSGSHPGGGLTCAPGALAAMSILRG